MEPGETPSYSLLGVSPGSKLCATFLHIAKYFKTLHCGCGAVVFFFSIYLKPVLYTYIFLTFLISNASKTYFRQNCLLMTIDFGGNLTTLKTSPLSIARHVQIYSRISITQPHLDLSHQILSCFETLKLFHHRVE